MLKVLYYLTLTKGIFEAMNINFSVVYQLWEV